MDDTKPLLRGQRRMLPWRRHKEAWHLAIAGNKLYISTGEYKEGTVGEVFCDWHKQGVFTRHILHVVAQLVSLALQYGVPLKKLCKAFRGQDFEPKGAVTEFDDDGKPLPYQAIKSATSVIDLIFHVLELEYLSKEKP